MTLGGLPSIISYITYSLDGSSTFFSIYTRNYSYYVDAAIIYLFLISSSSLTAGFSFFTSSSLSSSASYDYSKSNYSISSPENSS